MQPHSLDYAPSPKPKWKRLFLRTLVALIVAAVLAGAGWQIKQALGPVWWRWKVSRARQVCATCIMPPNRAALDFDGKDYYPFRAAPASPADQAMQTIGLPAPEYDLVFSHQRRTRAGTSRIVLVIVNRINLLSTRPAFEWKILQDPTPVDPAGFWGADAQDIPRADGSMFIRPYAGHPLIIYSGVADPTDESHFTIDYLLDGRRGTIDGYIEDNPTVGWPEYLRLTDRPTRPHDNPNATDTACPTTMSSQTVLRRNPNI